MFAANMPRKDPMQTLILVVTELEQFKYLKYFVLVCMRPSAHPLFRVELLSMLLFGRMSKQRLSNFSIHSFAWSSLELE